MHPPFSPASADPAQTAHPARPRTSVPLSLLVLTVAFASGAHAEETIPILAWNGPPSNETTVERYRELADAGFTQNFSGFPNTEAMLRALDVGQATGIKLWASVPELQTDPEGTVQKLKSHPALAGYYLRDEPSAADFPALATWSRRIQAADPAHPCYINLFPNYANAGQLGVPTYRDYVTRFVAEVPVPFLSFDHYPVVGKSLRGEWYENLEVISHTATEAKKPFWGFVLAVAHNPYPVPTLAHLRLEAFSNLVYGAQTIQHFTYWTPKSDVWNFHQAPIETDGKRTDTYAIVKQVNAEIRAWSPVFLGAHVIELGHLGALPHGTSAFQINHAPITELHADGPAIASVLEKGGTRYLAIVNRALEGNCSVEITFANVKVSAVGKDGAVSAVKDGKATSVISPGDMVVYRWQPGS